ncbi:MAG: hypothetical protein Q9190_003807 [Brigantiaea leucoxantha]
MNETHHIRLSQHDKRHIMSDTAEQENKRPRLASLMSTSQIRQTPEAGMSEEIHVGSMDTGAFSLKVALLKEEEKLAEAKHKVENDFADKQHQVEMAHRAEIIRLELEHDRKCHDLRRQWINVADEPTNTLITPCSEAKSFSVTSSVPANQANMHERHHTRPASIDSMVPIIPLSTDQYSQGSEEGLIDLEDPIQDEPPVARGLQYTPDRAFNSLTQQQAALNQAEHHLKELKQLLRRHM